MPGYHYTQESVGLHISTAVTITVIQDVDRKV